MMSAAVSRIENKDDLDRLLPTIIPLEDSTLYSQDQVNTVAVNPWTMRKL